MSDSAAMDQPLQAHDHITGQFKRLTRDVDYVIDEVLGFVSLAERLEESEALAVAFRYMAEGTPHQVGDFSADIDAGADERLAVKLLRRFNLTEPRNLGQPDAFNPAVWYLEMRNIYQIGFDVAAGGLALDIFYHAPDAPRSTTLPGINTPQTLLQTLGFDRLAPDGTPAPDDRFDYLQNLTIEAATGLVFFPYLEPFGGVLERLIEEAGTEGISPEEAREAYVFDGLYRQKVVNALRDPKREIYSIRGCYHTPLR